MKDLLIAIAKLFGHELIEFLPVIDAPDDSDDKPVRYIQIGLQPYAFKWLSSLPYRNYKRMDWNKETGWQDIRYPNIRLFSIVDTEAKTVTEIHIDKDDRTFAWTFLEARGKDGNPHPTGGFWWVILDE